MEHRPAGEQHPGKDVPRHTRVDADAGRRLVAQAVDDVDLALQRFQRLQAGAELHGVALTLGPPASRADTRAHELHDEPLRRRAGALALGGGTPRRNRLEPRKGHHDPGAAQEEAARKLSGGSFVVIGHDLRSTLDACGTPAAYPSTRAARSTGPAR